MGAVGVSSEVPMARIKGGVFQMGSDRFYPEERPVRTARVVDFWMDVTPVTNRRFSQFIQATGYVTFAERPPDPAHYPGLDPALAQAGSAVFMPPLGPPTAPLSWWRHVPGANWRHPTGPCSDLRGLEDHPVVHVVAEDAEAYALWTGQSQPTEAEWEYAARAGRDGCDYAWGDEFEPGGRPMAKTWQGVFPCRNLAQRGFERTAPVGSYPANDFGLYDMIGNVWEWTSDWYQDSPNPEPNACCGARRRPADPADASGPPRRVLKGGSHLCSPDYCRRYRPAARWPQPIDTSTSHVGFRCVRRVPMI